MKADPHAELTKADRRLANARYRDRKKLERQAAAHAQKQNALRDDLNNLATDIGAGRPPAKLLDEVRAILAKLA